GSRLHSLLSIGAEVFDLIVIDGPPLLGLADAQILAGAASATVFVVGAGQVRPALVRASMKYLQLSRAYVVGAVLTKHDTRAAGYGNGYSYSYSYSYGHGYGSNPRGLVVSNSAGSAQPQLTDANEDV